MNNGQKTSKENLPPKLRQSANACHQKALKQRKEWGSAKFYTQLRNRLNASADRIEELTHKNDVLMKSNEELEAALRFYADKENWQSPSKGFALQYDREPSAVEKDKGSRASKAVGESDA